MLRGTPPKKRNCPYSELFSLWKGFTYIVKDFFRFCCVVCKLNNFDGYILISLINSVTKEVEVSFYWGTFTR